VCEYGQGLDIIIEITMSNETEIDKAYVSPYDKFLFEFDATHQKSASQMNEIAKHAKLARMRDDKNYSEDAGDIWSGF
jgi:hypothetical protein